MINDGYRNVDSELELTLSRPMMTTEYSSLRVKCSYNPVRRWYMIVNRWGYVGQFGPDQRSSDQFDDRYDRIEWVVTTRIPGC